MKKQNPKTKEEAREYAIEWQRWTSEQNLSCGEIVEWEKHFETLAVKFDLVGEFKENGII